jgi:hypothetical protein
MDKIIKLSATLKNIFAFLMFLPLILATGLWLCLTKFPEFGLSKLSHIPIELMQNIEVSLAFLVFSVFLPMFVVQTYWLEQLWKLFSHYSEGRIFTEQNSGYVRRTAVAFLSITLLSILIDGLLTIILPVNNDVSFRLLFLTVGILQISNILTGVVLIVIAWIMDEAHRLQQEIDTIV